MAHASEPKTVYILSDEPVSFIVDHRLSWDDLRSGGSREMKFFERYNVIPLSGKMLIEIAPEEFKTQKSAERWIENNYPPGQENGTFTVENQRGRRTRYIAPRGSSGIAEALQALQDKPIASVKGVEHCLHFDGALHRAANDNELPEFLRGKIYIYQKVVF